MREKVPKSPDFPSRWMELSVEGGAQSLVSKSHILMFFFFARIWHCKTEQTVDENEMERA